jgi:hypothetical protein
MNTTNDHNYLCLPENIEAFIHLPGSPHGRTPASAKAVEPASAKAVELAVELTEVDQLRAENKQLKAALEWMQSFFREFFEERTRREEAEERARNQSLRSVILRRSIEYHQD